MDAERLGQYPALLQLLGMDKCADASTLGQWLRGQSRQSLHELQAINRDLVAWTLKKADPKRVRREGRLECFFDDTQIELSGRYFEGSEINYNGDRAYSWQTMWVGPFLADQILDAGNTDVSAHLPELLADTERLWGDDALMGTAHFYADSGSSAGKYLNVVAAHRWSWSISYNKWTEVLGRLAAELPEEDWSEAREATGRKGQAIIEQHGWLRHLPGEECKEAQDFAVVRYRDKDGLLIWNYAFVVCGGPHHKQATHKPETAALVFARHKLKGACELGFGELLSDLDLHHPPCQSLIANQVFYALATLAYNLMQAFRVLYLADAEQGMRVRSLIRHIISVPVKLVRHANRLKARLIPPPAWLRWWELFLKKVLPKRSPGRPKATPPPPSD